MRFFVTSTVLSCCLLSAAIVRAETGSIESAVVRATPNIPAAILSIKRALFQVSLRQGKVGHRA